MEENTSMDNMKVTFHMLMQDSGVCHIIAPRDHIGIFLSIRKSIVSHGVVRKSVGRNVQG